VGDTGKCTVVWDGTMLMSLQDHAPLLSHLREGNEASDELLLQRAGLQGGDDQYRPR
jgi:hypothetical protein